MAGRLKWDEVGNRKYELGLDRGVIYPMNDAGAYPLGAAWDGLTSVEESPGGGEETPLYANNSKYGSLYSKETFGGTIEAYTYPDEFALCDGSALIAPGVIAGQQTRKPFGFTYRSMIGNDVEGDAFGYRLVLVWAAKVSPSSRTNATINDSPEAQTFSWTFTTTEQPVTVPGQDLLPMSKLTIISTDIDAVKLKALEDMLYGTDATDAKLPSIDEVITLLTAESSISEVSTLSTAKLPSIDEVSTLSTAE